MQQRGDRPGGVGAAAEPEQEEAVAGLEAVHDEHVGVAHIRAEAIAEGQTGKAGYSLGQRRQRARRRHRAEAGMIVGHLRGRIGGQREEQLDDVGPVPREFVGGSVTAHHHVLGHAVPPPKFLLPRAECWAGCAARAAGEYVNGKLTSSINLASGRFAMIDDGTRFPPVSWIEKTDRFHRGDGRRTGDRRAIPRSRSQDQEFLRSQREGRRLIPTPA